MILLKTKISNALILFASAAVLITSNIYADGFIRKEVYSFKDKSGNMVFTDRKPKHKQTYNLQTIEAANSTHSLEEQNTVRYPPVNDETQYINNNNSERTIRVVVEQAENSAKKSYKKKRSVNRCKTYKKKLTYYNNKMKAGYKSSEYQKLEANRKKYRKLLFNNCATKTFND